MEIPGFQESAFHTLREPPPKLQRKSFDRAAALQNAPDHIKPIFKNLFRQIDTLELTINYYELQNGKRQKPPRTLLLNKFTEEEQQALYDKAKLLDQYKYLKMRHLLVELRSEQYNYYDMYCDKVRPHGESISNVVHEETILIGENIQVAPLGLKYNTSLCNKIFGDAEPEDYTEKELHEISELLWRPRQKICLDFQQENHILSLYQIRDILIEEAERDPFNLYSAASLILGTLQFYEDAANLTTLQKDILEMKIQRVSNARIADYINKEYDKTYNDNYISTLYHKKIIASIAAAARSHREIMENIFYPENFKRCKDCGRLLLLNSNNFVRQKKTVDGFSPRCKRCEKIKRGMRKCN